MGRATRRRAAAGSRDGGRGGRREVKRVAPAWLVAAAAAVCFALLPLLEGNGGGRGPVAVADALAHRGVVAGMVVSRPCATDGGTRVTARHRGGRGGRGRITVGATKATHRLLSPSSGTVLIPHGRRGATFGTSRAGTAVMMKGGLVDGGLNGGSGDEYDNGGVDSSSSPGDIADGCYNHHRGPRAALLRRTRKVLHKSRRKLYNILRHTATTLRRGVKLDTRQRRRMMLSAVLACSLFVSSLGGGGGAADGGRTVLDGGGKLYNHGSHQQERVVAATYSPSSSPQLSSTRSLRLGPRKGDIGTRRQRPSDGGVAHSEVGQAVRSPATGGRGQTRGRPPLASISTPTTRSWQRPAGRVTPQKRRLTTIFRSNASPKSPFSGGGETQGGGNSLATMISSGGGGGGQSSSKKEAIKDTVKGTVEATATHTSRTLREAFVDLGEFMSGPKSDTLLLLLATALITPLCKQANTSPILGFLAAGMLLGPNGFGLISGIHTTETLAELGIVFFLFEMGIELSVERLTSMKRDVFGLGMGQFLCTAMVMAAIGKMFGQPANAVVVLGGGLALSSSAFVLQLLKDKNQLATRFGRASFGVLLFQDLAVVPLLVVTPILAGSGSLARALSSAMIKATLALSSIAFAGRFVVNPLFATVAQAKSQEAFLGLVLLTVLSMSFLTEGLGLSNTLGAFLAGVLLSETKYRYQVEADIAPFRGILLGLFFVTVGFEIDLKLIASNFPVVSGIVLGIIAIKALVTTLLSLAFGLSLANAQQSGFILSQGGEFAFVAFGLARGLGILTPETTKLMLTCIALTMALTPFLVEASGKIAQRLEEGSDFSHYMGQDPEAIEIKESDDFVVVVGYGVVGKVVCDLLDAKFVKYVGLEIDPNKAIQARNKGLPVFYGDIGRPEVAEAFNVGRAKAAIITISDQDETNRAVISLRRQFPDLKMFARAKDANHQIRLQKNLDVAAMVPILPEDNLLLTLPFGGAVLKALGAPAEEVNAILEAKRKDVLSARGLDESEEETIQAQLGILNEDKKPDIDMKESSMVAEVIEANISAKDVSSDNKEEEEKPNAEDVPLDGESTDDVYAGLV